jgi:hypothetical protein
MKTRKYFRPKWAPGEAAAHWDTITEALNYGQPMTCDGRYSRRQVEDAIYRAFMRRAEANLPKRIARVRLDHDGWRWHLRPEFPDGWRSPTRQHVEQVKLAIERAQRLIGVACVDVADLLVDVGNDRGVRLKASWSACRDDDGKWDRACVVEVCDEMATSNKR